MTRRVNLCMLLQLLQHQPECVVENRLVRLLFAALFNGAHVQHHLAHSCTSNWVRYLHSIAQLGFNSYH